MLAKRPLLLLDRRVQVVEIQTALADGYHLLRSGQRTQLDDPIGGTVPGVVRVDADGRENVRVVPGDFDRSPIGIDRSDRAHRYDFCYSRLRRPSKNLVEIGVEPRVGQVAVRIDQRRRHGRGFSILGKSCTGAFTRWPGLKPRPWGARAVTSLAASSSRSRPEVIGMNGSRTSATTRRPSIRVAMISATRASWEGSFASVNGDVATMYLLAASSACQTTSSARLKPSSSVRAPTFSGSDANTSPSARSSARAPPAALISPAK